MRFATIVFLIAGVWGIVVLTPLYFMFDDRAAAGAIRRKLCANDDLDRPVRA